MSANQDTNELSALLADAASAGQPLRIDPTVVLHRLAHGELTEQDVAAAVTLAHDLVRRTTDHDA